MGDQSPTPAEAGSSFEPRSVGRYWAFKIRRSLSSAPSIEDIRRQITSAASQGLSSDTVSRSRQKEGRPKPGSKASGGYPQAWTASQ